MKKVSDFITGILSMILFSVSLTTCKTTNLVIKEEKAKISPRTVISENAFIIHDGDSDESAGYLIITSQLSKEEEKEVKYYIAIDRVSSIFAKGKKTKEYKKQLFTLDKFLKEHWREKEERRQNPTAWRFEDRTLPYYD